MSDSESSEEFEVKVEQEHEAKVRELIERAKEILPTYTEESLFNIYKESFLTENVFLNKVDIIARQQRLLKEEGEEEWHYSKKGERQPLHQSRQSAERQRTVRERYNFLEDAKLIERAQKYKLHERNEAPREKPQQFREKVEDKKEEQPPRERQEKKKEKANQSFKQKKILYKQKEENASPKNQQPIKAVEKVEKDEKINRSEKAEKIEKVQVNDKSQKTERNEKADKTEREVKTVKGYVQKKPKYTEKKEQPTQNLNQSPKKQESKPAEAVNQQKKPENHVTQVETKQVTQVTKSYIEKAPIEAAKNIPIRGDAQILQEEKKVSVPAAKAVQVEATVKEVKIESSKRIDSQKDIKINDPEVEREFLNSISQNSFILKFIKPSNKLQKVSYIRYPDGSYKDVKIREPLEQKS